MSSFLRLLIALGFVVALAAGQPNCAYACSCVPPGTPAEELNKADAVFVGRAVTVNVPTSVASSSDVTTATFETSKVWKGQLPQTLTLTTPGASASCGVTFTQGEEYVVYARLTEGKLTTTLCSRTNTVANAAEDIAALDGKPAPAQLPRTGAAENPGFSPLLVATSVALLALGVSLVVVSCCKRLSRGT